MKKITICLIFILFSVFSLSGCTHEMVSLYIYKMPNKLVYEIGEELDLKGLELRNIKTDSALIRINSNNASFSGFDSTKSGKIEITVRYGNFSSSFYVYVANKVANNSEEMKNLLENVEDNDILLLKEGDYLLDNPVEIDCSNIIIGGEGKDKTKLNTFFILGGYLNNSEINYVNGIENISFIGLTLNTKNSVKNNIIEFENKNINYKLGAINFDDITGLNVISCNFTGYSHGIIGNTASNLNITSNNFKNLLIGAIKINNSISNSSISKNIITNIGESVLFIENNKQLNIFGIYLSFNKEENSGLNIYKNSISKVALNNLNYKYLNEKPKGNFSNLNYMYNSSAIIIRSSDKNNLQTQGISIFFNSIGSSLNNILYGTTESDRINSNSVMYMAL